MPSMTSYCKEGNCHQKNVIQLQVIPIIMKVTEKTMERFLYVAKHNKNAVFILKN